MSQGDSIVDFVGKLDAIVQQLAARGNVTFNEQAVISKILSNLSGGFDSLIPAWRMQPIAPKTLDNFTLQSLQIESTLKSRIDEITSIAAYITFASGKTIEYTPEQRAARCKEINDRKKNNKCWKCGLIGHWSHECTATEADQWRHQESQAACKSNNDQSKKKYQSHKGFIATLDEVLLYQASGISTVDARNI